jgi:hypothetical protein
MPGQLNPDKNLFSVAPVGGIIIVGHSMALRGGLTRERALNLATWLLIATNATPKDIKEGIAEAMTPTGPTKVVPGGRAPVSQEILDKIAAKLGKKLNETAAEVENQVTPFIGTVDAEEATSLANAVPSAVPVNAPTPTTQAVSPDSVTSAWGKVG